MDFSEQNVECLNLTGGCPTSFPAPCSMAASFNMSLVKDMGNAIGREVRDPFLVDFWSVSGRFMVDIWA